MIFTKRRTKRGSMHSDLFRRKIVITLPRWTFAILLVGALPEFVIRILLGRVLTIGTAAVATLSLTYIIIARRQVRELRCETFRGLRGIDDEDDRIECLVTDLKPKTDFVSDANGTLRIPANGPTG